MKIKIYSIIAIAVVAVFISSCQKKGDGKEQSAATDEKSVVIDSMSPYHIDKTLTEVTFSENGDTLLRYPYDIEDSVYTVPPTVKCIYDRAFMGCRNLREVTIPPTVERIDMAAFDNCQDLERVFIQAKLDTMPYRFLNGCMKLKEIHVACKVPPVVEKNEEDELYNFQIVFGHADLNSLVLYVPAGCEERYKRAYGWRLFKHVKEEKETGLTRIRKCIVNGDARQLASLVCHYPFSRPYPLKDIENQKQMIAYFDILFDEHIKRMLRNSTDEDWNNGGWRGYYFSNGLIWASPDSLEAVNYMSAKEKALYEKTIKKDMISLHPSLQKKGLRPLLCYQDMTNGSILRVDKDKDKYRLALYHKGTKLSGIPDVCVYGTLEIQGSMAIGCFSFKKGQTEYEFDDDSEELIISVSGEIKERHQLSKCYWLDKI